MEHVHVLERHSDEVGELQPSEQFERRRTGLRRHPDPLEIPIGREHAAQITAKRVGGDAPRQ